MGLFFYFQTRARAKNARTTNKLQAPLLLANGLGGGELALLCHARAAATLLETGKLDSETLSP
jgi:hypothetical protein